MSLSRLTESEKELLIQLYEQAKRTRDDLPYTKEFKRLHAEFVSRIGRPLTMHQVWKALASLGKASRLARKER